jgi:hypothetical protein
MVALLRPTNLQKLGNQLALTRVLERGVHVEVPVGARAIT